MSPNQIPFPKKEREFQPPFTAYMISLAASLLGVPYEFGGQSFTGLDCSGLVVQVLRMMGFRVVDMSAADLFSRVFTLDEAPLVGPVVPGIFLITATTSKDGKVTEGQVTHVALVVGMNTKQFAVIDSSSVSGGVSFRVVERSDDWVLKYMDTRVLLELGREGVADGKS